MKQDNTLHKTAKSHRHRRMPVWLLMITDILLAAVCIGALLVYQLVLPQRLASEQLVVATAADSEACVFALPDQSNKGNDSNTAPDKSNSRRQGHGKITNYSNTDTDHITSDISEGEALHNLKKNITEVNTYKSDHIEFTTNKIELGTYENKITYYISDIYVTSVKYLRTAFALDTFGKNLTGFSADIAKENNALLAISGDYYGNSESSFVIRNGVLYRNARNDADVCVLFTDGTMKTYSPKEFDADTVIAQGAWQAWTFGPALLDGYGNMPDYFNTTDYLYGDQPRTAIGYAAPGHYVFAVVDGRSPGYSRGATLNELAQLMQDAGCVAAYNLDGGKSSSMVYKSNYVNIPYQGGREISDIIFIGE